jgi:hypothetical protein
MKVENLENLKKVIDMGYIAVVDALDNNQAIYQKFINKTLPTPEQTIIKAQEVIIENTIPKFIPEVIQDTFIKDKLKQNIMEGFFSYYLTKDVSDNDLEMLKWFYKNIGFTSQISQEVLDLIDGASNSEELTEVLLNHVYPELLEQYLSKQHNEKIITT